MADRTQTVRISAGAYARLRGLSASEGRPMSAVIDAAIDEYERDRFFAQLGAGYGALRGNAEGWAEELAERDAWEQTLADGLDTD